MACTHMAGPPLFQSKGRTGSSAVTFHMAARESRLIPVVERLPEGRDWIYKVKFDGYRAFVEGRERACRFGEGMAKDLMPSVSVGRHRRPAAALVAGSHRRQMTSGSQLRGGVWEYCARRSRCDVRSDLPCSS